MKREIKKTLKEIEVKYRLLDTYKASVFYNPGDDRSQKEQAELDRLHKRLVELGYTAN